MLDKARLQRMIGRMRDNTKNFLGYPVSKDFDYSELSELFKYPLNNLGDPFVDSTYGVHSNEMERDVVTFFADLFRAKKDDWWGYVTNGGSEGNLYSLYLAREKYPKGIVYYSDSTHYSVRKNIHVLDIESIAIRSLENGEIDYDDLHQTISTHRNTPVIIVANIGTTMTEAVDDVNRIKKILKDLAIQHSYIHSDAALSGVINAFAEPKPCFDMSDGADSITISGHKFIGSPIPCGVTIVKKANRDRIALSISYTGSLDTTITGSRNGHSPAFLWYAINKMGKEGLKKRVERCWETARYALAKMQENGIESWMNKNAITIVFPPQPNPIYKKWQLATEEEMTHVICMPNVTTQQIDELVEDIVKEGHKTFPVA